MYFAAADEDGAVGGMSRGVSCYRRIGLFGYVKVCLEAVRLGAGVRHGK